MDEVIKKIERYNEQLKLVKNAKSFAVVFDIHNMFFVEGEESTRAILKRQNYFKYSVYALPDKIPEFLICKDLQTLFDETHFFKPEQNVTSVFQ